MTGVLLVDKPEDLSSAAVIRALAVRCGRTKIGHAGTLDPFASGLLPLCLGEATKVARWLLGERKAYTGRIVLGTATDTLDRTGTVVGEAPVPALDPARVAAVAVSFEGPRQQVPPMYSALKRDGVRLYELARQGLEVERAPRAITIVALHLHPIDARTLAFDVVCSKGTYVRVLAEEIAAALGTVGHLGALRRTAVGPLAVADAVPLDALRDPARPLPLVPVAQALPGMRRFVASPALERELRHGRQAALQALPTGAPGEPALLLDGAETVVALLEAGGPHGWRLARLLHPG
jgi:tRNA pseudouridine55 synthase